MDEDTEVDEDPKVDEDWDVVKSPEVEKDSGSDNWNDVAVDIKAEGPLAVTNAGTAGTAPTNGARDK